MAAKRSRWEDSRRSSGSDEADEDCDLKPTEPRESRKGDQSPHGRESSSGGEEEEVESCSSSEDEGRSEEDGSPARARESDEGDTRTHGAREPSRTEQKGANRGAVQKGAEEDRGVLQTSEQDVAGGPAVNAFANDGSFLEFFKRKMEAAQSPEIPQDPPTVAPVEEQEKKKPSAFSFVGKRRGGTKLALKTGIVEKKQKTEDEISAGKGGAWAQYMAEVKKYKAHQCSDDDKTRPLVK
ncbi:telomerase RNA component interacting RNase [Ambystoma mexicanum]|uniref:telomerase RNA component interacting RNase n=1 Tax=Ambystoma mexicanum TaxID=8296 RepID=UPI0037E8CA9E